MTINYLTDTLDTSSQTTEFSSETTEGKLFLCHKFEFWILDTFANAEAVGDKSKSGIPIALLGILIGLPVGVLLIVVSICTKMKSQRSDNAIRLLLSL